MVAEEIIEDLKASNVIEEEMLHKTKEGFNSIIDGMIQECRKRNAKLEDLEEVKQKNVVDRKTSALIPIVKILASMVQDSLAEYRKVAQESYEQYEAAYDEQVALYERELKIWSQADQRNDRRIDRLEIIDEELSKLTQGKLEKSVRKALDDEWSESVDEQVSLEQEQMRIRQSHEKAKKKLDENFEDYKGKEALAAERGESFKLVAKRARLQVKNLMGPDF